MSLGFFLKNIPFLKNLTIYIYFQGTCFDPKKKKNPILTQKMPHISSTPPELMFIVSLTYEQIVSLTYEQKIFTIPHVSPAGSFKLYI